MAEAVGLGVINVTTLIGEGVRAGVVFQVAAAGHRVSVGIHRACSAVECACIVHGYMSGCASHVPLPGAVVVAGDCVPVFAHGLNVAIGRLHVVVASAHFR